VLILKRNSRKTGKPVNQIIEEAVLAQARPPARNEVSRELRIKAMKDFIEEGRPMPRKVVEEALAEDYYDQ
jgi:hypothetical protein